MRTANGNLPSFHSQLLNYQALPMCLWGAVKKFQHSGMLYAIDCAQFELSDLR